MPKNAVREKTILTEEQIKSVFDYFLEKKDFQLMCWFALAIASGSRFSELLRFKTDIINENNTAFEGLFLETLRPVKSKGRTKTGKLLTKYIIKDVFWPYYQLWLPERDAIMKKNNKEHDFIFIKSNGEPAKEGVARGWANKIEEFLGVPFYPHCARHYATSYLSKIGLPYDLIKEILGWASTSMVEIYDDQTAKDKNWKELDNLTKELNKNK
jgi:integrase